MFDFFHFLPPNANSAYLAMPNMVAAIDMYVDFRHYAGISNKVNPEDRDFFARHFLDSDSDDAEEFYDFEGVNFVLLERIENPPDDFDFWTDVINGWSRNPADDKPQMPMLYDYSKIGLHENITAESTLLSFVRYL